MSWLRGRVWGRLGGDLDGLPWDKFECTSVKSAHGYLVGRG